MQSRERRTVPCGRWWLGVVLLSLASAALAWRTGLPAGGILLVQVPLLGVLLRHARSGRKAAISG